MNREKLIDIVISQIKDDNNVCDFRALIDIVLNPIPSETLLAYLDRRQVEMNGAPPIYRVLKTASHVLWDGVGDGEEDFQPAVKTMLDAALVYERGRKGYWNSLNDGNVVFTDVCDFTGITGELVEVKFIEEV